MQLKTTKIMRKLFVLLFAILSFSGFSQDLLIQSGVSSSFPNRTETAPPVFSSAAVENTTPNLITVTLSDASDINTQTPNNLQWSISGVASNPIITAQIIDGVAKTIELTLSANVIDGDVPLLTYVNPGDGSGIKDINNNFLASFSNSAVTNNTGALPVFAGNNNLQWLFTSTGFSGTSTIEDRSSNNNDGTLVKSHCLTSDGTLVFTFSSLAGITITSDEGTSTLAIVGNTITATAGTVYHIVLSNGSVIPCAEGSGTTAFDAVNSLNATLSGTVDWTGTQDTYHYNILNGFSHLGRLNAINQYVTLTSNILFSTTKFSIKIIYAPDAIATTQDILGTATTANQLAFGTSAGSMNGTLRLGSGTTYTLSCASTAAAIGWANNVFSTIILTRDPLGNVTLTINGFTILIDSNPSVVDATSTTFSQLMRTSTSNNNIGILKEVEILDAATASLIGTKYNADNGFRGTLQGGFATKKYPKPQGGDVSNRNAAGNWHNAAETRVMPNPSGNATLQTATGWTNTTELTYAQLTSSVIADPSFINEIDPIRKRSLTSWTTPLGYVDEITANNYVGKTTISVNNITGWSSANRLAYTAGSSYNATSSMTVKIVVKPVFMTGSMVIFGKTAAVSGNGWAVEAIANAAGSDLALRVRDGTNTIKRSRNVTFSEKEDDISIYHFVIRGGFMYSYRNGHKENTAVAVSGITTSTDDLIIGALSGGSQFTGGILAVALYENTGMTDNEVEASYQATKNNVYVEEDGITLLFGSESGNANWVDRVGGSVTMTKSGTLTVTPFTQAFNYRWRPEDSPSTTVPSGLSTLTSPTVRPDGDSRTVSGTAGVTTNGLYIGVRTLTLADSDISGTTYIGSQGSAPVNHYGLNGEDSDGLLSTAPGILSVNGTYPANIIVNFVGTNAMTSETLFDREVEEWERLMFSYKRDIPGVRFVVVGETEHDDANRRARSQDLMYQKMLMIERLSEQGYNIIFVNPWRALKIQDGDFIDVVHPNDQGNGKLAPLIYQGIRLSTNHSSIPWYYVLIILSLRKARNKEDDHNEYKLAA
jgi:hypothetical protein